MSVCAPCDGLANDATVDSVPNTVDGTDNPRFCRCAAGYGFGYKDDRQLFSSEKVAKDKCA